MRRFFSEKDLTFQKKVYNIICCAIMRSKREWRNWQTRTFEGRVVHTVRVQVPFPAPRKQRRPLGHLCFFRSNFKGLEGERY